MIAINPGHALRSLRDSASCRGFALVATLWTLGLIAVLATVVIAGARYRTKNASTAVAATRAALAAESGINLGIFLMVRGASGLVFPIHCKMPDRTDLVITAQSEAGKVDLNTANRDLLIRLFVGLTRDQKVGQQIADNLLRLRPAGSSQPSSQQPLPASPQPGSGPLVSVMQLDQVADLPPDLFRAALPFVTVRSGRSDLQLDAASPKLRGLLNMTVQSGAPTQQVAAAGSPSFTIRADAATAEGSRFIREALVWFTGDALHPFEIREWRHGDIDVTAEPIHAKPSRDCLQSREPVPTITRYWN